MKRIFNPNIIAGLSMIVIAAADLGLNSDISIGTLYIIPLIIAALAGKRPVLLCAFATTLMQIADASYHVAFNLIPDDFYFDKLTCLFVTWICAFILTKYKTANEQKERQKEEQIKLLEEILFMTSHRVRKPIAAIQGLSRICNKEITPDEFNILKNYLNSSVGELDTYTRELTQHIHESKIHMQNMGVS